MSDHFSFPYGPSSSVATIGNDSQVEDRIGERERGIKGRGNDLVSWIKEETIILKD